MNYPILLIFISHIFVFLIPLIFLKIKKRTRSENASKFIGAGIATIPLLGSAIAIGNLFSTYLKYPDKANFPNLMLGFALADACGLFGLAISLIILFAF